jgi:Sugar transferases involved in lipopolysaccharide synthesis
VLAWYRPPAFPGSDQVFTYSRAFVGLFALADLLLVVAGRMTIRLGLRKIRLSGLNLQRILVIGAGALGREITTKILAHREMGFEVVGFLDDDPRKVGSTVCGLPVLGTLRQADEIVNDHDIDQVFVALPLEAHKKMLQVIDVMAQECVEIKLVPDILQYAALRAGLEDLDGTPVINLSQVPLQGWNSMLKRAIDVGMAIAVMIALIPIVPLIALLIWLEDRGPIFTARSAWGLDGKPFMIVKFRSMRVNAEATSGPVWACATTPAHPRRQLPAPHLAR